MPAPTANSIAAKLNSTVAGNAGALLDDQAPRACRDPEVAVAPGSARTNANTIADSPISTATSETSRRAMETNMRMTPEHTKVIPRCIPDVR